MNLYKFYQASDLLLKNKDEIESYLYKKERSVFQFKETITLYDLTNTYFEGSGKYNKLAAHGKSKEKRADCPLVTLGLSAQMNIIDTFFVFRYEIYTPIEHRRKKRMVALLSVAIDKARQ